MIFRKSQPPAQPEPEPQPVRPGSKGRPTRSRREAEAARRRPLVVTDRKEARRRDRERSQRERMNAQQALMTGDEKNMPIQHRGPERRLVRDVVDSRRNLAEIFFPVALAFMLVALVLPLVRPDLYMVMSTGMIIVLWGGIIACVVDSVFLRKRLRAVLTERFGDVERGLVGYGIMRSIQIRRWRLPRPMIKHGEAPRG
ncbi:DUF3043 domain-containing protein [Brachybacterium sp. p3-SID1565]|uniref:DUF3043 domain-containing protein n=1 Tax=Brachybacterium epidermidis TaxID=2781983 RepID=A0ABR9W209_9MICO|nr:MULTISPECIES: DUF3043 domain-containing protein [unclassified Brachybacterium]MBE9404466.1 DUF3043 domain-containing protein [Brachybacterium epidermidis]MCT1386036.1 DUF3043 domain-containing protein [Brachybacterium sp. p3-SID1565]MCT1776433.1 DUF3043 domain-containing protein [Brachybacterium sp. p3-SID957]